MNKKVFIAVVAILASNVFAGGGKKNAPQRICILNPAKKSFGNKANRARLFKPEEGESKAVGHGRNLTPELDRIRKSTGSASGYLEAQEERCFAGYETE